MDRPVKTLSNLYQLALCFLLFCSIPNQLWAAKADSLISDTPGKAESLVIPLGSVTQGAPVILWNRTITVFRKPYKDFSPKDRASLAVEQLIRVPANSRQYKVEAVDATEDKLRGAWIKVNDRNVFGIIEGDEDAVNGETFQEYKESAVVAIKKWLEVRKEQYRLPLLLRSIGFSLIAILVAFIGIFIVMKLGGLLLSSFKNFQTKSEHKFRLDGVSIAQYALFLASGIVKLLQAVLIVSIVYIFLTFIFSLFPYTQPWSKELSEYLLDLLQRIGQSILKSIPGLATVAVIFFLARLVNNIISSFFKGIEQNTIPIKWFEPETAKATRMIVVLLIWVFAFIFAYPMIPGSDTKAFQGVSVFLGLMISIGSSGLIGQLVGGLIAVYMKSFRKGDYIRIGEHEGVIKELGLLAAKILSTRDELITIPNILLISSTTINYSRQTDLNGSAVTTNVTIGYDTPWRQVHAMLEIAAGKTKGIKSSPKPFVIQKALSDFYVEYTLLFRVSQAEARYWILSELHGHILDVFNEYGVQIMSPNFVTQPENDVVVPKNQWYAKPSHTDKAGKGSSND